MNAARILLSIYLAAASCCALAQSTAVTDNAYPVWAYLWAPDFKVPPADDVPQKLAGSTAAYSWAQARDLFVAPDWHPGERAPMPEVVARGRKPDVRACGSCHRVEGTGGPENAALAGLPAEYMIQQMRDFKSGARKYSGPQRAAIMLMLATARATSDEDSKAAAEYFASLKPQRRIKVVESDNAPKTYVARLFFAKSPDGGSEPLGKRIVEMPDDVEQFELRDSHATFTAYVPKGSVGQGDALAKTNGGKTQACAGCHGADLRGMGAFPGIAGRSPTYIVRQLYDFKTGVRAGTGAAQMKPVVDNLSIEDMIALAAYAGSLAP